MKKQIVTIGSRKKTLLLAIGLSMMLCPSSVQAVLYTNTVEAEMTSNISPIVSARSEGAHV